MARVRGRTRRSAPILSGFQADPRMRQRIRAGPEAIGVQRRHGAVAQMRQGMAQPAAGFQDAGAFVRDDRSGPRQVPCHRIGHVMRVDDDRCAARCGSNLARAVEKGHPAKLDQRLRARRGQRPHPGAEARAEDHQREGAHADRISSMRAASGGRIAAVTADLRRDSVGCSRASERLTQTRGISGR